MPRSRGLRLGKGTLWCGASIGLIIACAQGGSPGLGDSDEGEGGTGTDGNVVPKTDSSKPPADASGDAPFEEGGTCPTPKVVINELMTGSSASASDEFIELYNPAPSGCAVDMSAWQLVYKSASGTSAPGKMITFPSGTSAPGGGTYLLFATSNFAGVALGTFTATMAAAGGQVGLIDDSAKVVDAVGWGTAVGVFTEGNAAPAPPGGSSLSRKKNGVDSNDNSADFAVVAAPTPGAAN